MRSTRRAISAEEAPRLRPFVDLADKLGTMMGQLLRSPVKGIEITYKGAVTKLNTNPMSAAALSGLLESCHARSEHGLCPCLGQRARH